METVGTNVMERIGEVCVVPEGKYVLRWGTPGLFLYVEPFQYGAPWVRGTTYTNINGVGMGELYIPKCGVRGGVLPHRREPYNSSLSVESSRNTTFFYTKNV